ncbi:hypothetical protein PMAYCL1PPCAC_32138, partial [Pristionchus mayeri]
FARNMLPQLLSSLYFYVFDRLICYYLLKLCSSRLDIRFMNLGYINEDEGILEMIREKGAPESEVAHIALYEKTLSSHPRYPSFAGFRLLEVGCGQGGGMDWFNRSHPEMDRVIGLDRVAIREEIISGDAQDLPFASSTFDIIINIESSHLYRNPQLFFHECARVLPEGGHLCWADLRFDGEEQEVLKQAARAGLQLVSIEDITPSVLRGMKRVASRYDEMLKTAPWYMKLFGDSFRETYCAPGTKTQERYVKREKRYWTACWVKE